jgi:hypothetical protein
MIALLWRSLNLFRASKHSKVIITRISIYIMNLLHVLEKIFDTTINLQEVWQRWRFYKAIECVSFMNNCSLKLMVANCQCLTGFHVIYSQRHYCLLRSVPFVSRNWEKTTRFHNLVQILGQLGEPALEEYVEIMSGDVGGIGSRIFTSSYRP